MVGAALAGAGRAPTAPSYLDPALDVPLRHDSSVARLQDAIASVLWRGLHPDAEPRTELLVPPLVWDLTPDDATAMLSTLATSIHAGLDGAASADRGDRRE